MRGWRSLLPIIVFAALYAAVVAERDQLLLPAR